MKKIFIIILFLLLGSGCSEPITNENSILEPKKGEKQELSNKTTTIVEPFIIETNDFTLTLPPAWKNTTWLEDFSGYGSGEGDNSKIPGYAYTFGLEKDRDFTPMFVIMRIPLEFKKNNNIPQDQIFVGENNEFVFYASTVEKIGTNSFLYKETSEEQTKLKANIPEIFKNFKILANENI